MTSEDTSGLSPKRAAAYIRVSSEEQTEGWSMEGQEQTIREYAERHGFEIAKLYTDDTTGSEANRPGLESMMLDAQGKQFQAIIVVHTSRLFRNVALARMYKERLRNKLDVDVVFMNQPTMDPNDPSAYLTETINELFDEYYLIQLSFWTTLGKKTRAQQGMWNGTLPFGYVTDEETGCAGRPSGERGRVGDGLQGLFHQALHRCADRGDAQSGGLSHDGQLGCEAVHQGHRQSHPEERVLPRLRQVQG